MRTFLISSAPVLIWCIAAIELVLGCLLVKVYCSEKKVIALLMALVTFGLFYDALMIALGRVIINVPFLSVLRYLAHGCLIPLLIPIGALGMKWKGGKVKVIWVITGILMLAGAAQALASVLEPLEFAGVVRYVSTDATPRWAQAVSRLLSFGTVIPLILSGIVVLKKEHTPDLLLSGLLMFVFAALGPATGNMDLIFLISMFGELFMALFFLLFARRISQ